MKQTLQQLYDDRDETGDITFIVDSEEIRAHRCILAALSPKYKVQFFGPQPDKDQVEVEGVTTAAFKEFLQFFYLGEVVLTVDNIGIVISLAQQSLVNEFLIVCINFLKEIVAIDNLCKIYRLAVLYDVKDLQTICESKIRANIAAVIASDDFVNCDRDCLISILQMDSLECREIEVLNACIAWAKAACERKHIDSNQMENLRAELGAAISEIRFCSMTIEEFVVLHKKCDGFFTLEESNEIMLIIGKLPDFKSEKFNQRPRSQTADLQDESYSVCNRLLPGDARLITSSGPKRIFTIFNCNRDIRLKGFATGVSKGLETVKIFVNEKLVTKYTVVANEHGFAIMFEEPMDIRREKNVVILMHLAKALPHSCYNLSKSLNISINDNPSDAFVFDFRKHPIPLFVDAVTKIFFSPLIGTNK